MVSLPLELIILNPRSLIQQIYYVDRSGPRRQN